MIPSTVQTFTEFSKVDIVGGIDIFEADFEKYLTGCFLRNSISKAAHCFLGMVDDTSMVWVLFFDVLRLVNIPNILNTRKILLLWYGLICPDDAALGQSHVALEWKVHAAMADPEKIPTVSVWRMTWRDSFRETMELELADLGLLFRDRIRWVSIGVGGAIQRLNESVCCSREVPELVLDTHIPVCVVFQNQRRR